MDDTAKYHAVRSNGGIVDTPKYHAVRSKSAVSEIRPFKSWAISTTCKSWAISTTWREIRKIVTKRKSRISFPKINIYLPKPDSIQQRTNHPKFALEP